MSAYNKTDLIDKIAQKTNLTKIQAEAAVNAFQEVLVESVTPGHEGLRLTGLFLAEPKEYNGRKGRNPQTGEEITIPDRKDVHFKVGTLLKKAARGE